MLHAATALFVSTRLFIHLHFEWEKEPSLEEVPFHRIVSFQAGKGAGSNQAHSIVELRKKGRGVVWGGVTGPKPHLTVDRAGTKIPCPVSVGGHGLGGDKAEERTDVPWDTVSKPGILKVKHWHSSC